MIEGDPYWYVGHKVILLSDNGPTARIRYEESGKERTVRSSALRYRKEYVRESAPSTAMVEPRHLTVSARRGRSVPKSKPVRSRTYMDFVKGHKCCVCQAPPPSDPHHYGPAGTKGMGLKTDDLRTVPLCRLCHDEFHAKAEVCGVSGDDLALAFYQEQVRLLVKWFAEKDIA